MKGFRFLSIPIGVSGIQADEIEVGALEKAGTRGFIPGGNEMVSAGPAARAGSERWIRRHDEDSCHGLTIPLVESARNRSN